VSYRPPVYLRQRCSGRPDRAFSLINGKRVWLGKYGTDESRAKYAELLNQPQVSESEVVTPSADPTVSELIRAYLKFASTYYQKPDGSVAREYEHILEALKYVRRLTGATLAREFGPKMLKTVRQELIDKGLSRVHINAQVRRIIGMFRWAVEEETIPETTHRALAAVRNLKRGRSMAKESVKVKPVAVDAIDATLAKLPEVIADMYGSSCLPG
jgi:hypothetical protein